MKRATVTLAELKGSEHKFAGAIHAISMGLVDAVNKAGVVGVVVAADEEGFCQDDQDE